MGVGERKGKPIIYTPWYTWGDSSGLPPNMELFWNNSEGFFLDIPPAYRCMCFEWTQWIIYLCKWGVWGLFVFLHSSGACQFSDIISRRFLDAFFPEDWSGPEFLISIWRAFSSRIWLMIISHFLEALSIAYEKWGLRNWFSGGQPHPQQGSTAALNLHT